MRFPQRSESKNSAETAESTAQPWEHAPQARCSGTRRGEHRIRRLTQPPLQHTHEEAVGIFPRSTVKLESPIAAESWEAIWFPLSHSVYAGRVGSGRSPLHQAAAYPLPALTLNHYKVVMFGKRKFLPAIFYIRFARFEIASTRRLRSFNDNNVILNLLAAFSSGRSMKL